MTIKLGFLFLLIGMFCIIFATVVTYLIVKYLK